MVTVKQADAAGHGRDLAGHFLDGREIHVAHQPLLRAVHAHVDHHRPGLDHVGRDELRPADGHDENVGRAGDAGQIAGAAVADGHRGVAARAALHEHDGHRLADDVAAAHHHDVGPGDCDVVPQQHLLDAVGRAGQKSRPALHDPAHVLGMEGVDVLERIDGLRARVLVDLLRQRQLHQDAVDRRVAVEPVDQGQKLVGGGFGRGAVQLAGDAGLLAGLLLVANVDLAGRVFAHQHGRQAGRHARRARRTPPLPGRFPPEFVPTTPCRRGSWQSRESSSGKEGPILSTARSAGQDLRSRIGTNPSRTEFIPFA